VLHTNTWTDYRGALPAGLFIKELIVKFTNSNTKVEVRFFRVILVVR